VTLTLRQNIYIGIRKKRKASS